LNQPSTTVGLTEPAARVITLLNEGGVGPKAKEYLHEWLELRAKGESVYKGPYLMLRNDLRDALMRLTPNDCTVLSPFISRIPSTEDKFVWEAFLTTVLRENARFTPARRSVSKGNAATKSAGERRRRMTSLLDKQSARIGVLEKKHTSPILACLIGWCNPLQSYSNVIEIQDQSRKILELAVRKAMVVVLEKIR
jgi:hypothetical protein